jgi:methyl-accepting chemotaxis protein
MDDENQSATEASHGGRLDTSTPWRSGPTVSGVSKRISAEDEIETIVEQARVAEAGSTNRMAFLQDVSVLCLVGLRQLAKEIDRLDRRVDVLSNGKATSRRAEAPAVELVELATQLGDLTSQVTTMTKAVKRLSKNVGKLSKDVKRLSKKKKRKRKKKRKK